MGHIDKMTNVGWVVYEQDIDQAKLVILTNLFLSVLFCFIAVVCSQLCFVCMIITDTEQFIRCDKLYRYQ